MADNRFKQLFREAGSEHLAGRYLPRHAQRGQHPDRDRGYRHSRAHLEPHHLRESHRRRHRPMTRRSAGLLERDLDAHAIFETVAVHDIQDAADLFRPIYDVIRGR